MSSAGLNNESQLYRKGNIAALRNINALINIKVADARAGRSARSSGRLGVLDQ
jgi:hypothetical protein